MSVMITILTTCRPLGLSHGLGHKLGKLACGKRAEFNLTATQVQHMVSLRCNTVGFGINTSRNPARDHFGEC